MTIQGRVEVWLQAARLARDNARARRRMAKQWPSDHREWIEHDLEEAHKAFKRAYGYIQGARYLRSYQ